jgi:integrase
LTWQRQQKPRGKGAGGPASGADGELHFGSIKTYESRSVSLPGFLVEKLARHLERVPKRSWALVLPQRAASRFAAPIGGIASGFRHSRAAGLPQLRIHDLRHTCAALLMSRDHNPKSIQANLGHSSITVTL